MVNRENVSHQEGQYSAQHYGIDQWVDFARGLVDENDSAIMRKHLASGCSECSPVAGFFEELNGVCRSVAKFDVPQAVLRQAYAIIPARGRKHFGRIARIRAELIFDSFLVPVPAGLRATWQVGWQGLYRAGDCSLDLRIEPELRSSRAAVIGQISNHLLPHNKMSDIPVCLKSGRAVVAETRSNQFGEFQMEYDQQGRLQLCVYLDGGAKCLQVPLKRFASDKPAGTDRLKLGTGTGSKQRESEQQ